ncbi:KAP family P-loop NTPase fold protein [Streptomyces scabiei]|uniref:KAP family P-loop NTPase fold protein n=1 Tax=Streptomyces scabiei TaxID=1930 RepID=UPI0029A99601|nr:P-loop NTPase fold protein [Streptomyces scabiei]MDX2538835.1 P-loop NTPase fold protein [Streptomyces scabiei]MDX2802345.1 P-loop NTPase fold protein [Streptomyces scabiei]MDX2861591.1 P-loop NTPase fold protein [Streptomyces scabiei]MDX3828993.1 P-loop NTPase fold protein [Streptomyces scabiei]
MNSQHLLGDDPVDAAGDELDRKRFSEHMIRVINRVRVQSESSVIALIGPWGSGKSSILGMVKDSIDELGVADDEKSPEWRVADFNPWIHSDSLSMYVGFYSELRACLPGGERWSEARESIGSWIQNAAPLGKLGGVVRVDASSAFEKLAEKVSGDTSAAAKREKVEEALKECSVSILVVMDDLDRLTPEELLEVFKMIRLVGRLPNVYYLLSYDEKTLMDVLCRTDLAFADQGRARSYLEKMVQVRLDMPALGDAQRAHLVNSSLSAVLENNTISLPEASLTAIASLWREAFSARLTTPRAIRRFFAQVDSSYVTVADEVNFVDFLALTFLRTHEPRLYYGLQEHREELTMTAGIRTIGLQNESPKDRLNRWKTYVQSWDVAQVHADGVLAILAKLFLPLRSALEGMEYGRDWLPDVAKAKGVGHTDYFSRYFFFGVPSDDIPDSVVDAALDSISQGEDSDRIPWLLEVLEKDPERIVRKVHNYGDLGVSGNRKILLLMAEKYFAIPNDIGFLSSFSRTSIEGFTADLFLEGKPEPLQESLDLIVQSDGGYCMAVRGLRRATSRANRSGREEVSQHLTDNTKRIISGRFENSKNRDIASIDQSVFSSVHTWAEIDSAAVIEFLRGQAESGTWPLVDIVDRLVTRGTTSARPGTVLMGLEDHTVESTLGLGYVFEHLSTEIDNASTDVLMEGLPDTPENRRSVALAALSFSRHRRQEAENEPGEGEAEGQGSVD